MENATKALIIVAGVLIGIMILSLGAYLYYALGGYMTSTQEQLEANAKNKFNTQFLKYINVSEGSTDPDHELTIQDVITAANLANQNNTQHGLTEADAGANSYYVTVNANLNGLGMKRNLENENAADMLADAVNHAGTSGSNYTYECRSEDIVFSNVTGRVIEITFK